jgi:interleukin-1 receptor-associated kinase 1
MMRMLLLPLLVVVALVSPPAMATCRQECGGLKIQYPFGIGRGCYLNRAFEVTCDDSNGRATIDDGRQELLSIDVPRGQARVASQVSSWCYDAASRSMGAKNGTTYDSTAFRVSGTDNVFTVIGCSTFALVVMDDGGDDDMPYAMGCITGCREGARSLADGPCTSTGGCCQVPIPSGSIRSFEVDFSDFNTSSVASISPCGYAMVVEKAAFVFRRTYATTGELMGRKKLPMVLDWVVGNQTCKDAERRNNGRASACVSVHSNCVDFKYGTGYLCRCSDGYQGNPYIRDGCKGHFSSTLIMLSARTIHFL